MIRGTLDRLAEPFGLYAAYQLDKAEYIGWYKWDERRTANVLLQRGYERTPWYLTALKYHWDNPEQTHSISLRKVDPENERKQYHVHLFGRWIDGWDLETHNGPVVTDIASHHEYRPDLGRIGTESHTERMERLRTHYRPTYGENYIKGKACEQLLDLV